MTKTIFTKVFAVMSIMASALFFVSCDDNQNEPGDKVDPYAIKSLVGEHVVEVSEDYLYFFDVTVTYNVDGEEQQLDIDFDEYRNTLSFDTDYCEIPSKISGVITATPKNPVPEYDTQKAYNFDYSNTFTMTATKNNGQKDVIPVASRDHKFPVGGVKLQDYLNKGVQTFGSFEYTR